MNERSEMLDESGDHQDPDAFIRELCLRLSQEEPSNGPPPSKIPKIDRLTEAIMPILDPVNHNKEPSMDDDQTEESGSAQENHEGPEGSDINTHGNPMDLSSVDAIPDEPIAEVVTLLTKKCTYLSHQLNMIMNVLKIPPCLCSTCEEQIREERADDRRLLKKLMAEQGLKGSLGGGPLRSPLLPFGLSHIATHSGGPNGQQNTPTTPKTPNGDGESKSILSETETQFIQQLMAQENAHVASQAGRRSKYCSNEDKKAVAEYAQIHGAAAAARKFNIPPPVAAYYQRKHSQRNQHSLTAQQQAMLAAAAAAGVPPSLLLGAGGPPVLTPTTPNQMDETTPQNTPSNTQPSTPQPNQCEMAFKMSAMPGLHQPQQASNQMFVRGRGRGRPKLIGDELDMHLVEYMVQLKKTDPTQHLTASKALDIAREYIVAKQPGLLEEHGGQVKLKITWAMKLVQRVAEREREIEMGLPPGTLQNLGRLVQQMPNGAINPMDLMTAQSMLSNGLMTPGQGSTPDFEALFQAFTQSAQAANGGEAMMPEIIKGQEIDIAALLGLCGDKDGARESHDDDQGEEDDENEHKEEESASSVSPQSAEDQSHGPSDSTKSPSNHPNFIFAS